MRVRPGSFFLPGSRSAIRFHSASDIACRSIEETTIQKTDATHRLKTGSECPQTLAQEGVQTWPENPQTFGEKLLRKRKWIGAAIRKVVRQAGVSDADHGPEKVTKEELPPLP